MGGNVFEMHELKMSFLCMQWCPYSYGISGCTNHGECIEDGCIEGGCIEGGCIKGELHQGRVHRRAGASKGVCIEGVCIEGRVHQGWCREK
jgi:hypothetical protein